MIFVLDKKRLALYQIALADEDDMLRVAVITMYVVTVCIPGAIFVFLYIIPVQVTQ